MTIIDVNSIIEKFVPGEVCKKYGNGHINDTYLTMSGKYILQRINTEVFKNPDELMDNILGVTAHLREKIVKAGGNPERETLTVIKTLDGKNYYITEDGACYRMYKYITDSKTVDSTPSCEELYNAAKGFGKFQKMLDDYPADKLVETIPDFHNTPDRFKKLKEAVKNNIAGRRDSVKDEIEFALSCEGWISKVTDGLKDGSIPLRVTHNDTKINNVLFDANSGDAICVIDLDTVMPGSLLYDFGDALRIGAATCDEDEVELSKVEFDLDRFESFSKGFYEEMKDYLTPKEKELLGFSAKLLTFECGIRFLTDYLNGDTYFKIHREHHNLDRARTHFKLVADIEKKENLMKEIIYKISQ